MFSPAVLDRFHNPRNTGEMSDATHYGVAGVPGDGPYTQIWLKIEAQQISHATFETYPCPAAVACACMATELAKGRSVDKAQLIEPSDIIAVLGGVPEGKGHCADRSVKALRAALSQTITGGN